MKGLTIRFIEAKDRLENIEDGGYVFKKGFSTEELKANTFYYINKTDTIVQINTNYNHIDCMRKSLHVSPLKKLSKEGYLNLIKTVALKGENFYLQSLDDEIENYMEDMELYKVVNRTPEEYVEELEYEFDVIYPELYSITLRGGDRRVIFYKGGTISYDPHSKDIPTKATYQDMLEYLGNYTELLEGVEDCVPIEMSERSLTNHPMSELHVLTDYLRKNKDTLPKEVIEAMGSGVEEELGKMSKMYKGMQVYKK